MCLKQICNHDFVNIITVLMAIVLISDQLDTNIDGHNALVAQVVSKAGERPITIKIEMRFVFIGCHYHNYGHYWWLSSASAQCSAMPLLWLYDCYQYYDCYESDLDDIGMASLADMHLCTTALQSLSGSVCHCLHICAHLCIAHNITSKHHTLWPNSKRCQPSMPSMLSRLKVLVSSVEYFNWL